MKNNLKLLALVSFFVLYLFVWILVNFTQVMPDEARDFYTDSYGIMALIGSLIGFGVAKRWGGFSSIFGKAVYFLSIGLLMQFLGQLSYAIYHYVFHVDNPYPSFGELFYFGSIPVYIVGIYYLARAVGVRYGTQSMLNKILLVGIPVGLLIFVYATFLKGYSFEDTTAVIVFLDFGYPIGQAVYLTLAAFTFLFARSTLGGALRVPVFVLLGAFFVQYLADLIFSIKTLHETWQPAGISDLTYLTAYFLMGIALYSIGKAEETLTKS